jgi:hypothetical protein
MDAALVFRVVNLLPIPVWAVWVLAPRSALARALSRSLWPPAVLAALYVGLLAVALRGGPVEGGGFGTLAGVMALFRSPWMALTGWVHYLCFDLFVGRWIVNDAPDAGYRLAPILVLTLLVSPAGLLCYLAVRGRLRPER